MATDFKKLIDELVTGKHLSGAAILSKDGSVQAASPGFQMSKDEAKILIDGFEKSETIATKGVSLAGKKYQFLSKTANFIKTKAEKGGGGGVTTRTPKNVVVGIYDDKLGLDGCTKALESVAEKLKKSGL